MQLDACYVCKILGECEDNKHTISAGDTCLYLLLKCKKILKLFLIFAVSFKFVFISACLTFWEMEKIKTSTKSLTIVLKHEILKLHNSVMKVYKLANEFHLSHWAVGIILKREDTNLMVVNSDRSLQTTLIRNFQPLVSEMEKWIRHL